MNPIRSFSSLHQKKNINRFFIRKKIGKKIRAKERSRVLTVKDRGKIGEEKARAMKKFFLLIEKTLLREMRGFGRRILFWRRENGGEGSMGVLVLKRHTFLFL